MLAAEEAASRELFTQLKSGDRIEIEHEIKVGREVWTTRTQGTVVRTERRRHGLHFRRNRDDKVYSDVIVFARDDGELSTATMDEFTRIARMEGQSGKAAEGQRENTGQRHKGA